MDLAQNLEEAKKAALEAGKAILKYYEGSYQVSHKSEDQENPLTSADLEANGIIESYLKDQSEAGWLSEESIDDPKRLQKDWVWIVDPLDGTKEFIKKVPEFGVSIGLVYQGVPKLGVFYNPVTDSLFWGREGEGVYLNETKVKPNRVSSLSEATLLISSSEHSKGLFDPFPELKLKPTGSIAYKLSLIAAGQGEISVTLNPRSEWDICAGAFFVTETGLKLTDHQQNTIVFNQEKPLVSGGVIAAPVEFYDELVTTFMQRDVIKK